jgi:hypothetical protein
MGQYLHHFENESDFNNAYAPGGGYVEPWVSLTDNDDQILTAFTLNGSAFTLVELIGNIYKFNDGTRDAYCFRHARNDDLTAEVDIDGECLAGAHLGDMDNATNKQYGSVPINRVDYNIRRVTPSPGDFPGAIF